MKMCAEKDARLTRVTQFGTHEDIGPQNTNNLCIAFKTNRNFVYLNIKRGMIHVDLSMAPEKVDDPKGAVRNMDGIGHRGAGNSRITIKDKSDIPYLMILLDQSYRKSLE